MTTPRTSTGIAIRLATPADASAMAAIYNHEVENHTSTFDLRPRSIEEQRAWISQRSGAFSAVVAEIESPGRDPGEPDGPESPERVERMVVGFASLSTYKERPAYSTTVENSVYVSRDHAGRGIGKLLMTHIVDVARDSGFHSIIARVEASGTASRALHETCGFRLVGIEEEVGRKFGRWLSVAVYQLRL